MYPKLTGNGKFLSQIQYGSDYSKSTSSWINHEDMVNVYVIFLFHLLYQGSMENDPQIMWKHKTQTPPHIVLCIFATTKFY